MMCKFFLFFTAVSISCFSSNSFFFDQNAHLPAPNTDARSIHFVITRTLDNGALKSSLLKQLKELFSINAFIETGTYLGDTTSQAAEIFSEVHTVELAEELYTKAKERFQNFNHVSVYRGSSDTLFKYLLPTVLKRILFYLDGHYSGHVTARGSLDTPLLRELQVIRKAKKTDSLILIDDIRLFQASCFPEKIKTLHLGLETYPDLEEVIAALLEINPDYQICFLGDALLAFPKEDKVGLSPVARACALHRLAHLCANLSDEELRAATQVISKADSEEKEEIAIYYQTYSPFELDYGYRSYACFWHALVLREAGQHVQAASLLDKVAENSLPNWRVLQCLE